MNVQNLVNDSNLESFNREVSHVHINNHNDFNYEILDKQTEVSIKQKTTEIKKLIRQTAKNIVIIGQKLSEVKQQLKHGEFRNWLKAEFDWSISSATKFMQVSKKFKNINFTHFNFSASALYILAAPSTPESAREYTLQLASRGENITYSLAKLVVKKHKELAEIDTYNANQLNPSSSTQLDSQNTPLEDRTTGQFASRKYAKSVRIIHIKHKSSKQHIEDKVQDFEIIYAGISISVQGSPKELTVLFKKMQESPQFAEDIFTQAALVNA